MDYEEEPAELPRPALSKDLGSSSGVVFVFVRRLSIFLICSIVPVNSWNWPSMEFILVFNVEMEPTDRSSFGGGLSECVIVLGTGNGDCNFVFGGAGDHFFAVYCPRVDTESSSFPYAVVWRIVGFNGVGGADFCVAIFSGVVGGGLDFDEIYCDIRSDSSRKLISSS